MLPITLISFLSYLLLVRADFKLISDPNYQTFKIYDNLTTSSQQFNGNLGNLEELWSPIGLNTTSRWCSQTQGLWIFYSGLNFSSESSYYGFIKTPRSVNITANCANLEQIEEIRNGSSSTVFNQIRSVRHMSHANLSIPAISLFTSKGAALHQELFLDGHALSLPQPMTFSAYGFSGFENWTLFSDKDFSGISTCLLLPLDYLEKSTTGNSDSQLAMLSFGVPSATFQVGSLKLKCSGDEDFFQHPVNTTMTILNLRNLHLASSIMPSLFPNPDVNHTNAGIFWTNNDVEIAENRAEIELQTLNSDNVTSRMFFSGRELVLPEPLLVTEYNSMHSGCENNVTRIIGRPQKKRWGQVNLCSDLGFTGTCHPVKTNENVTFESPILVMSVNFSCLSDSPSSVFSTTFVTSILIPVGVFMSLNCN